MRTLALAVLLVSSSAVADDLPAASPPTVDDLALARQDIVDARYGREPRRARLLGFDDAGAAYVRVTLCEVGDASALLTCKVTVDKLAADGTRTVTPLMSVEDEGCEAEPCPNPISYEVARDFLAAERAWRAGLPPLSPGTPLVDGGRALGDDIALHIALDEPRDDTAAPDAAADHGLLRLVAQRGPRTVTLWSRPASEERIKHVGRFESWRSPDGKRVVIVATFGTGVMCWGPFAEFAVAQVDLAATRRRLGSD